jgi:[ribosomal protein S5]-alanine N-acetyltransferase
MIGTTNPRCFMTTSIAVLISTRLVLRQLNNDDAPFILALLNEPSWLHYIGDKQVRSIADAEAYIQSGPADMVARPGFGLLLVNLKEGGEPIGICGLLKRQSLQHVDLGFAFAPKHWGRGYAQEAANATLLHAHQALGLDKVLAVTTRDNIASIGLLTKLGFRLEGKVQLEPAGPELNLYQIDPSTLLQRELQGHVHEA